MDRALVLIEEARAALQSPEAVRNLAAASKDVSLALNDCVNCLPGQKDVDDVIANIDDAAQILAMNEFPHTTKPYGYDYPFYSVLICLVPFSPSFTLKLLFR